MKNNIRVKKESIHITSVIKVGTLFFWKPASFTRFLRLKQNPEISYQCKIRILKWNILSSRSSEEKKGKNVDLIFYSINFVETMKWHFMFFCTCTRLTYGRNSFPRITGFNCNNNESRCKVAPSVHLHIKNFGTKF